MRVLTILFAFAVFCLVLAVALDSSSTPPRDLDDLYVFAKREAIS